MTLQPWPVSSQLVSVLSHQMAQNRDIRRSVDISKYHRWYSDIIAAARGRPAPLYKERHHIVPACLGGSDDLSNLVDLTYREHFLVHWLLTKMHDGRERKLMLYAFRCMTMPLPGRRITGWQFELIKRRDQREAIERKFRLLAKRLKKRLRRIKQAQSALVEAPIVAASRIFTLSKCSDRAALKVLADQYLNGQPGKLKKLERMGQKPRSINRRLTASWQRF